MIKKVTIHLQLNKWQELKHS